MELTKAEWWRVYLVTRDNARSVRQQAKTVQHGSDHQKMLLAEADAYDAIAKKADAQYAALQTNVTPNAT